MLTKLYRLGFYALSQHIRNKLIRHLFENFLSQLLRAILYVLFEFHKLNDISDGLVPSRIPQQCVI